MREHGIEALDEPIIPIDNEIHWPNPHPFKMLLEIDTEEELISKMNELEEEAEAQYIFDVKNGYC